MPNVSTHTTRKRSPDTKKRPNTPDAADKAYEAFLQRLDIVSLALKECSARVNRQALLGSFEANKKLTRKFDGAYRVAECTKEYFDCEGRFTLAITDAESVGDAFVLVECAFEVHMHGKAIHQELADRFAQSELRLILTPYARRFVSDITAQMSIPPVIVPLVTTVDA